MCVSAVCYRELYIYVCVQDIHHTRVFILYVFVINITRCTNNNTARVMCLDGCCSCSQRKHLNPQRVFHTSASLSLLYQHTTFLECGNERIIQLCTAKYRIASASAYKACALVRTQTTVKIIWFS